MLQNNSGSQALLLLFAPGEEMQIQELSFAALRAGMSQSPSSNEVCLAKAGTFH